MANEVNSTELEGGVGRQPTPKIELLDLAPLPNATGLKTFRQLVVQLFALAFGVPAGGG